MTPEISVIIPVYNVENYICKCIESILNQTYKNLEIIIVIDGSTDNSEKLCRAYNDDRIKIINKENGGLSSARNAGINIATGKYISFIDSDDYIDSRMIEVLYKDMINLGVDVACCNYDFCNEQSFVTKNHWTAISNIEIYNSEEALNHLLFEDYYKCYAWNKLYKRELFNTIRYPDGKLYEDIVTTYNIFKQSEKISFNNSSLYHYRVREGSITAGKFNQRTYDMIYAVQQIMNDDNPSDLLRLGCMLYTLYFIDNMIQGGVWDKDVYSYYREIIRQIPGKTFSKVKKSRRIQMKLCYWSASVYRIIYKFITHFTK